MNRAWRSVLFGLAAMVFCGAAGPRAKSCFFKESLRAGIENAERAGKGVAVFLDGDDAQAYLSELNREAGSSFKGDGVMLFSRSDGTVALGLTYGPIGCVPGAIPGEVHQRALSAARGTRA